MKVQDVIKELVTLPPDDLIVYDWITTSEVIGLADSQFNATITRDEADTILCTMVDGIDKSQLQEVACNDLFDLIEERGSQ